MQYTEQEHPISILWNNVSRPTGYVAIIPNIGEDVDKYNNLAQLLTVMDLSSWFYAIPQPDSVTSIGLFNLL